MQDTRDDEFDYYQGVSTANFGDMLHDNERNEKFGLALQKAITKFHKDGKKANVLDIGTGTGLLAMLAVRYGADSIIACEMFSPVAKCAIKIIKENNLETRIKVVNKHSTQLTVGENGDLPQKANILVSEVFDTELIGEGAISTFNHAHKNLLEECSIVIPSLGIIYGQLVESNTLLNWNILRDWTDDGRTLLEIPKSIKDCRGVPSLFDLQLSQVHENKFTALTDPVPIFRFDFMSGKRIATHEYAGVICKGKRKGKAQAVFMWWDLIMDFEDEIILTCSPIWHHPSASKPYPHGNPAKNIPWRDHWMQAVYFLSEEMQITEEKNIILRAWHDEFSFWFATCNSCPKNACACASVESPVCKCGFHLITSRTRIAALNDYKRRKTLLSFAKQLTRSFKLIVFLGDFSLLPLILAKFGTSDVLVLTKDNVTKTIYDNFEVKNISFEKDIKSLACTIKEKLDGNSQKVAIVAEPYFVSSLLPWDNGQSFIHCVHSLFTDTEQFLNKSNTSVFPETMTIKGCIVKFDDLWKISYPLYECMGFKINSFDDLINLAKDASQLTPEPQPLWEYPCLALSHPITLFRTNLKSSESLEVNDLLVPSSSSVSANALAFWTEYSFDENNSIKTGPMSDLQVGQYINWNHTERQGVHLYSKSMFGPLSCQVTLNKNNSMLHFQL